MDNTDNTEDFIEAGEVEADLPEESEPQNYEDDRNYIDEGFGQLDDVHKKLDTDEGRDTLANDVLGLLKEKGTARWRNLDKAAKTISMILSGKSGVIISKELGVSAAYVSLLKKKLPQNLIAVVEERQLRDFGELISNQLTEGLEACSNIAAQTRDKDWLKKQGAAELATLYGVITDKSFRILQAIQSVNTAKIEAAKLQSKKIEEMKNFEVPRSLNGNAQKED